MALSAAANLTITDSGPSQAYQGYATADAFWTGALIELNLSTGLVAPLGVTGAPGAVLCGVCEEDKNITESSTTKRLDIRVDGPIIEGIAVTGVTADTDVGRTVYCTSDDIGSDATITGTSSAIPVGKIVRHVSGTTCDVMLFSLRDAMGMAKPGNSVAGGKVYSQLANSTENAAQTETAFDKTVTFPANTLQVGDIIRIKAGGTVSTYSSGTLTLNLRIDGTTIGTTGAVTPASADEWVFIGEVTVQTIGASGTAKSVVMHYGPEEENDDNIGAKGTAITSFDTTATIAVDVTATWSAASNGATQEYLTVEIVR